MFFHILLILRSFPNHILTVRWFILLQLNDSLRLFPWKSAYFVGFSIRFTRISRYRTLGYRSMMIMMAYPLNCICYTLSIIFNIDFSKFLSWLSCVLLTSLILHQIGMFLLSRWLLIIILFNNFKILYSDRSIW